MRFQCYEAIGVAIGEAGNVAAADHLIEDVLSWRFQYPEIQGATDEWETVVNPYPPAQDPLLDAHHRVEPGALRAAGRGPQRAAPAGRRLHRRHRPVPARRHPLPERRHPPIYFVAKQLLRAFPVYFNDVGAEGELRAVSTEVDEICERRDTLMHFLRKQSHAESSNRLVDFSRAVLGYWITLDPSGSGALPVRQHPARGPAGAGLGRGAARDPGRLWRAARRPRPRRRRLDAKLGLDRRPSRRASTAGQSRSPSLLDAA